MTEQEQNKFLDELRIHLDYHDRLETTEPWMEEIKGYLINFLELSMVPLCNEEEDEFKAICEEPIAFEVFVRSSSYQFEKFRLKDISSNM